MRMGTHQILIKIIKKLHHNFKLNLKIGKKEEIIPYGCGAREGDTLVVTIFIMVMQVNAIEIKKNYKNNVVTP